MAETKQDTTESKEAPKTHKVSIMNTSRNPRVIRDAMGRNVVVAPGSGPVNIEMTAGDYEYHSKEAEENRGSYRFGKWQQERVRRTEQRPAGTVDDLDNMSKEELLVLAEREKVEVNQRAKPGDIAAAIKAHWAKQKEAPQQ